MHKSLYMYTNGPRLKKALIRMILDLFIKSLKFWFLLFLNHHSDFFHWVIETFPIIPVDPFEIICVSILSIKICLVAVFIPPPSAPSWSTVIVYIVIVIVVRSKKHPVMVQHTVSWKKWSFMCEILLIQNHLQTSVLI